MNKSITKLKLETRPTYDIVQQRLNDIPDFFRCTGSFEFFNCTGFAFVVIAVDFETITFLFP